MNRTDTMKLVLLCAELWPSYSPPADDRTWAVRLEAWGAVLGDLPGKAVHAGILSLANREFAPSPGQIRAATVDMLDGPGRAPSPDAAWAEVRQAIGRVGSYGTPDWSHLAITHAMRIIPWTELCSMSAHDVDTVFVAHFRKAYVDAAQRLGYRPPPLVAGYLDRDRPAELEGMCGLTNP